MTVRTRRERHGRDGAHVPTSGSVPAAAARHGVSAPPKLTPTRTPRRAIPPTRHILQRAGRVLWPAVPAAARDGAPGDRLDADLPAETAAGPLRTRFLWQVAIIALVLRLCLLPLGHPWDTTTFYNVLIDLGHGRSPYDTMRYLNDVAVASKWGLEGAYQGYAYPPGAIYLYWPLAQIFTWLHPHLTNHFTVEGMFSLPHFPLDFFLWFKLPFWLGDLGIAILLWRMTGTVRSFRDYLLNPYVLLVSGAWTFDAVMVFCLLLAAFLLQRGRLGWSGVALAAGTVLKFIPGFIAPVFALYLIQRNRSLREVGIFLGAFVASCAALVLPFLQGTLYVLQFQGSRPGVGLDWAELLVMGRFLPAKLTSLPVTITVGTYALGLLVIGLLLVYRYVFLHEMPLNRMILITLLVYFLTSKVVNEQYLLAVVPFSLIELHGVSGRRPAWRGWRPFHSLLWIAPLVFAAFNVPLDRFLLPLYATVFGAQANLLLKDGVSGLQDQLQIIPWYHYRLEPYYLLAIAYGFVAVVIFALIALARRQTAPQWALASEPLGRYSLAVAREVVGAWTSFGRAARSIIAGGRRAPRRRPSRAAVVGVAADDVYGPTGALAVVPSAALDTTPHRASTSFAASEVALPADPPTRGAGHDSAPRRAPPFPERHPSPPEKVVR